MDEGELLDGKETPEEGTEDDDEADMETSPHPLQRWRVVQRAMRDVWRRWLREFLPAMNARQKWMSNQGAVAVDHVVIVIEKDTPRGRWPLGRVLNVFPRQDGVVRVVDVKVRGKVYRRPVHNLIALPVSVRRAQEVEIQQAASVDLNLSMQELELSFINGLFDFTVSFFMIYFQSTFSLHSLTSTYFATNSHFILVCTSVLHHLCARGRNV